MNTDKMNIEVWSDIMCPFCFIGKRRFENALEKFPNKEGINVSWKSFELYPDIDTKADTGIKDFLVKYKGISEDQALGLMSNVRQAAADTQLNFNWEEVVVANTRKAHELVHLAAKHGVQNQMKEQLFNAYFTDGKNVDDLETLLQIGVALGIDREAMVVSLTTNEFTQAVEADVRESQMLGVSGVPFFVLNRKYAVSGAQSEDYFLKALETAYGEWKNGGLATIDEKQQGSSCTPGSGCC